MKNKNLCIFFTALILLGLFFIQTSFALDNSSDVTSSDDFSIPITVEVNSTKKAEININTTQDIVKDKLTLKLNKSNSLSDINDFEVSGKQISFILDDNNFTQAILHINYDSFQTQTALKNIININIDALNTKAPYQSGTYKFKVTDKDTGEIIAGKTLTATYKIGPYFVMTQSQSMTTDSEGIATFYLNKIDDLNTNSRNKPVGDFNLTVNGNDNLKGSLTTLMTIEKANVVIVANPYNEDKGSLKNFSISVTSKDTGEGIKGCVLSLYIPGSKDLYYKVTTNDKGVGSINVSGLNYGEYPVTISANDSNLNNAKATGTIIIKKMNLKITLETLVSYYNSGRTAIIKVSDAKTSKTLSDIQINITVDGKSYYYTTDKNGKIEFSSSLDIGKHNIIIKSARSIYSSNTISKTFNVKKASGKFTASSKTIYYNSGKYLEIKLTNTKNKKGIFNAKIHFKIQKSKTQYSNYYGTTQKDGKIKFNINLKPGTYKVQINGDDSKNFKAKSTTVKMTIKKSPLKLTTKTNKKQLQIKVTNKISKKQVKGVKLKVKVFTGKNYIIYTCKSNSKGICDINLKSLKTGKHKISITSQNNYYNLKTYKKNVKL